MRSRHHVLLAVALLAACGGEEPGPPLELRPLSPPFVGPVYEPPEPEPPREPRPFEVVLDRLVRTVPADAHEAAWGLLGSFAAGETWKHGSHREAVRGLLDVVREDDGADPLVALAIVEAYAMTGSVLVRPGAEAAAERAALSADAPAGTGGLTALLIQRSRIYGLARRTEEDAAQVRAWVDHGWDDAVRAGGLDLTARTLGRLLLGDAARRDPALEAVLDRLLAAGPPVRDGRVADPVHLYLADLVFSKRHEWDERDRDRGRRWRELRRAATLPVPAGATMPEIAAVALGLGEDAIHVATRIRVSSPRSK